jgi:hypothetical protein
MHNNENAVIVNANPNRDKKVGISEKNSTPKIMEAIGSPPATGMDAFPVSARFGLQQKFSPNIPKKPPAAKPQASFNPIFNNGLSNIKIPINKISAAIDILENNTV